MAKDVLIIYIMWFNVFGTVKYYRETYIASMHVMLMEAQEHSWIPLKQFNEILYFWQPTKPNVFAYAKLC